MTFSSLTEFHPALRVLLQDRGTVEDASVRMYSADALNDALRTVIYMGRLNRNGKTFTVDDVTLSPAITDPNDYALLVYRSTELMVMGAPDQYQHRQRGLMERFGSFLPFMQRLAQDIADIEQGDEVYSSWSSFTGFVLASAGRPLWETMARAKRTGDGYEISIPGGPV